jgi:hypothetical protein
VKGMEERRRLGGEVVEVDDGLKVGVVRGGGGGGGGGGELMIPSPVSTTSSWAHGGEGGEALGAVVVWE